MVEFDIDNDRAKYDKENWLKFWMGRRNDKHVYTYALRSPGQSRIGRYEIVVKEYLFRLSPWKELYILPIDNIQGGNESWLRTNEGEISSNRLWYFGYSKDEHYKDAVKAFTDFEVERMKNLKERYERDMESCMNTITFLTGDANKERIKYD